MSQIADAIVQQKGYMSIVGDKTNHLNQHSPGETEDGLVVTPEVSRAVRELSKLTSWKSSLAIAISWGIIFSSIWLASLAHSAPIVVLAVLIVGCYQHGLLIIMHDAAHFRIARNRKVNDLVSNLFLAYPHFVTTEGYRGSHLAHHQYLNTDRDPDWTLKKGKRDWTFPKRRRSVIWLLVKDLLGWGVVEMGRKLLRFARQAKGRAGDTDRSSKKRKLRLLFYFGVFAGISVLGVWKQFIVFWLVPAFCILPALLRYRSLSEHFGLPWRQELDSSRNVLMNPVERFFLAPWNVNFHLNHHLFPSVPFYNLGKIEDALKSNPVFHTGAWENGGYFVGRNTVLDDLSKID